MDSFRNQQGLSEHSRVSSNSSQESSDYELIPKNQPIFKPKQDLPSPKLSNPFKRIGRKGQQRQQQLNVIIKRQQEQLSQLKTSLCKLREDYQLQSKANEIYSQSFGRIKQFMRGHLRDDGNSSLQQSIDKLFVILKNNIQTMERQQFTINQLKDQLLKSTQNNINAIFQHKFTQNNCVHIQLQHAEQQIQTLVTGYQSLKGDYSKLDATIKQINAFTSNQHQGSFQTLKRDLIQSIKQQLQDAKSTILRPSSNYEQVIIAKSLESKLNDLINTLYAPEKPTIQPRQQQQRFPEVRDVDMMRKIAMLEMKNSKLEKEICRIEQEKDYLQEKIINLSKYKQIRNKQFVSNQFRSELQQAIKKNINRRDDLDQQEIILASRSDHDQQKIIEQFSHGESHTNTFHPFNHNRYQNSHSHYQSSSKPTEIQALRNKLQRYEQIVKQKQMRIVQLQNTILDHIQSKPVHHFGDEKFIRERYQAYINNLKVLLNESRKEYEILRKEFIKINQINFNRLDSEDARSISLTVSDRTTKNNIAQTRLIQRRPIKNSSYETIKAKLQVQQLIQKAFFSLLELAEKVLLYQQIQRQSALQIVIGCIKQLLLELKQRNCKILQQINVNDEIKGKLDKLGIQLM